MKRSPLAPPVQPEAAGQPGRRPRDDEGAPPTTAVDTPARWAVRGLSPSMRSRNPVVVRASSERDDEGHHRGDRDRHGERRCRRSGTSAAGVAASAASPASGWAGWVAIAAADHCCVSPYRSSWTAMKSSSSVEITSGTSRVKRMTAASRPTARRRRTPPASRCRTPTPGRPRGDERRGGRAEQQLALLADVRQPGPGRDDRAEARRADGVAVVIVRPQRPASGRCRRAAR